MHPCTLSRSRTRSRSPCHPDAKVRELKQNLPAGKFMETDEEALRWTGKLQEATRELLAARYGAAEPYRVRVNLEFQVGLHSELLSQRVRGASVVAVLVVVVRLTDARTGYNARL